MSILSNCSQELRRQGRAYPRTCEVCGLGPCHFVRPNEKVVEFTETLSEQAKQISRKHAAGAEAVSILQSLGERLGFIPSGLTMDDEQLVELWHQSLDGLTMGTVQQIAKRKDQEDLIRQLLLLMGEDPDREGLKETPKRFLKALAEYTQGYQQEPSTIFKSFADGADGCDEMVVVRDIPFNSLCEHHLAPFFGVVHIGYIPNGRVLGLSKFARLTDIFARRLQVQERLTNQIASAIQTNLKPIGVGVVIEARHTCMEFRGVCKTGSITSTSSLIGVMKEKPEARAEFLELVRSRHQG